MLMRAKKEVLSLRLLSVQEKRLELSWYCYHTDLNRARLPIPPFLRTNVILTSFMSAVNPLNKNPVLKLLLKYFIKALDFFRTKQYYITCVVNVCGSAGIGRQARLRI